MARKRKSARTSARAKQQQQHVSWPGKVARRIKTSIKKLVG